MELKLFINDVKGYWNYYENIDRVFIKKVDNIKQLEISLLKTTEKEFIPLRDIELCFMYDLKNKKEVFRYER